MSNEEKRVLLQKWLFAHAQGRSAKLFIGCVDTYDLSEAAETLLRSYEETISISLYVAYLNDLQSGLIPIYIGKSAHPLQRWKDGHCRNLAKVKNENKSGSYTRWVRLLERMKTPPFIMCIGQKNVLFPPIPEFPLTIGSIEYQLISLASDAFRSYLLNYEGRSR